MMTKLLSDNFRRFESDPCCRGVQGSHFEGGDLASIFLDESLMDMLEHLHNPWETPMFNPLTVGRNKFTVEIIKNDGSIGKVTGTLFDPNFSGSDNEVLAHTLALLEQDLVKVWTDKGWRSFYQSKVVSFKFGGDN